MNTGFYRIIGLLISIVFHNISFADSLYYELPSVEINAAPKEAVLSLTTSEGILKRTQLELQPPYSLLPAANTIPGVRMEERSPGSYRFSIRGSLLRSPFGVTNVRFYLADLPLTDAGGNTYLNSLDVSQLNSARILKGPSSGLFGANTGGVVLLDPFVAIQDSLEIKASVSGGSFGLFHQNVDFRKKWVKSTLAISQAYQRSNGYRENSAMYRHYVQMAHQYFYKPNAIIKSFVFFSDLGYRTPGGLTQQQMDENPRAARPASPVAPGAEAQKAGINNKTIFGGITHDRSWNTKIRHIVSALGSYTNFQNPFITNYEYRKEATVGLRSYVAIDMPETKIFKGKFNAGGEWQQIYSGIRNFGNKAGAIDTLHVSDKIRAQSAFIFTRFHAELWKNLLAEASLSLNFFDYQFRNIYPLIDDNTNKRTFKPQWMPRVSLSYSLNAIVALRASVSRGFSVPALAEVRASDNIVNTTLQAEKGINYEAGIRLRNKKDILWLDVAYFHYQLKDAIVRRISESGDESFINAGGTTQPGVEIELQLHIIQNKNIGFIRALSVSGNLTWNKFSFTEYQVADKNYSGNQLTGTPKFTTVESLSVTFAEHISLYAQYYYASKIALNDANSIFANAYHLLQMKAEWKHLVGKVQLGLYAGVDNLLNQKYSLGNDLNAIGNRYFNPAPTRNYFGGAKFAF